MDIHVLYNICVRTNVRTWKCGHKRGYIYTEPLNPFGQYTYVIGHMKQTIVITLYAVEQ